MTEEKQGSLLGAILFVSGCCIGAGMIGLPVVSALTGFIPSLFAMIVCYFFATTTGLLLVEATLWFDRKVHLISIAKATLGNVGQWITWAFFLFLFYCLFVAYIEAGSQVFSELLGFVFSTSIVREAGIFFCVLFIGSIVYLGARFVNYMSRVFLLGLVLSYGALVVLAAPHVQEKSILHQNWNHVLVTIPILFICFGYQNLIPTIVHYVKRSANKARKAIFIGVAIPFIVYTLWNFSILGILPENRESLVSQAIASGSLVTDLLSRVSQSSNVLFFASAFSFFALLTPFVTCALAFVDFFKDGFNKTPVFQNDTFVYALVFTPPTIFTLVYPDLFLSALGFAGGFIDSILFGILPAIIVWKGRYQYKMKGSYTVFGGKPLLAAVFTFAACVVVYRLSEML